jgi:hypothetical protein
MGKECALERHLNTKTETLREAHQKKVCIAIVELEKRGSNTLIRTICSNTTKSKSEE